MPYTAMTLVQVLLIATSVFTACQAACEETTCPAADGTCEADTCWCNNQKGGDKCSLTCADDCSLTDEACEAVNTCAACDPVCVNGACTAFGYPATAGIACKCDVGWTGDACDEVDCTSSPCANGGSCDDSGASDVCNCLAGYTGLICDQVDCTGTSPCQNEGTCDASTTPDECTCATGFTGLICDEVDCTTGDPCVEGTCEDSTTPDECTCDTGYAGLICDKVKCDNADNQCENGGTCGADGLCDCAEGYTGDLCAESGASRITTALPLMLIALFIFKLFN